MNILDKAISFFDPSAGLRRFQKRKALKIMRGEVQKGRSMYEGARRDRRTDGWKIVTDDESSRIAEIGLLKARSRYMYRNNPHAFRAHNSITNNTVGKGILPAISDDRLKNVWKDWAEDIHCDFDEDLDFYGIQGLAMRTLSMQGEVIVLRIHTPTSTRDADSVPLQLKVLSAMYLDKTKILLNDKGGATVKGGVQYDRTGKKTGYWIYPNDPNEGNVESKFWKKADVIHLFFKEEPGQIRGVPFGTPSMMTLRDFDDYSDAQLMRQKVAACFTVFVTKTDADMVGGNILKDGDDEDGRLEKVEPGTIEYLEPGKQVSFASPPPAEGYAEYSRNVLTGAASGFGTTYEAMTGDLSNVNYSSGRMGWIEFQNSIETWQHNIIITKLCRGVWIWFVDAAVLAGRVGNSVPKKVEWTAPGRKMIDPVKEVNGLLNQVRAGFMSWQEAVRKMGYTPEEILEEMKRSAKLFDDAGLQPKSDPRFDTANLRSQNQREDAESTD